MVQKYQNLKTQNIGLILTKFYLQKISLLNYFCSILKTILSSVKIKDEKQYLKTSPNICKQYHLQFFVSSNSRQNTLAYLRSFFHDYQIFFNLIIIDGYTSQAFQSLYLFIIKKSQKSPSSRKKNFKLGLWSVSLSLSLHLFIRIIVIMTTSSGYVDQDDINTMLFLITYIPNYGHIETSYGWLLCTRKERERKRKTEKRIADLTPIDTQRHCANISYICYFFRSSSYIAKKTTKNNHSFALDFS